MRSVRGFTVIELAIVLAVIAIVAVAAGSAFVGMRQNADVGAAALQVATRLAGERAAALADQRDRVMVVVGGNGTTRTRMYFLRPSDTWTLAGFDPAALDADDGDAPDWQDLGRGVVLDVGRTGAAAPKPYGDPVTPPNGARVFDADLTTTCGGRTCFAIRFRGNGRVDAERPGGSTATKRGLAFALTANLESAGVDHKGVVVSFPTGIVKTFSL